MPKITELYAWVIADKDENDEGVPAAQVGKYVLPLMGADIERAQIFREYAQQIANESRKRIRLLKSTALVEVDSVEPRNA